MAKHAYEVTHESAGAVAMEQLGYRPEVGDEIELDLTAEQKQAMVAAGWIAEPKKAKGGKG